MTKKTITLFIDTHSLELNRASMMLALIFMTIQQSDDQLTLKTMAAPVSPAAQPAHRP